MKMTDEKYKMLEEAVREARRKRLLADYAADNIKKLLKFDGFGDGYRFWIDVDKTGDFVLYCQAMIYHTLPKYYMLEWKFMSLMRSRGVIYPADFEKEK